MKRPRLNALRTFEAAGRHASFSLAARDLGISQAAVSQQIRHLESYLGAPLFVRNNRRLALTGAGEAYLLAVGEALDRLDTITDQLFPDRADGQVVTLLCTASVATLWLVPRLADLQRACPGTELRVRTLDGRRDGPEAMADLEIVLLDEAGPPPKTRHWLTANLVPVCSPNLVARHATLHGPGDLARLPLIHVLGYAEDWHRWFRAAGLQGVAIPVGPTFDGSLMALEAAVNGDGVMLGRRPFIDQHLASGSLVQPLPTSPDLTCRYGITWRAGTSNRAKTVAVVDWLCAQGLIAGHTDS